MGVSPLLWTYVRANAETKLLSLAFYQKCGFEKKENEMVRVLHFPVLSIHSLIFGPFTGEIHSRTCSHAKTLIVQPSPTKKISQRTSIYIFILINCILGPIPAFIPSVDTDHQLHYTDTYTFLFI